MSEIKLDSFSDKFVSRTGIGLFKKAVALVEKFLFKVESGADFVCLVAHFSSLYHLIWLNRRILAEDLIKNTSQFPFFNHFFNLRRALPDGVYGLMSSPAA